MAIYLDHAATTDLDREAMEKMIHWMTSGKTGNPNSIHTAGWRAQEEIKKAKCEIAAMINAYPDEIYFTGGGAAANELCNKFLRLSSQFVYGRGITTEIEHKSNLTNGRTAPTLPDGSVDFNYIADCMENDVVSYISCIWINNETGTRNPIKEIGTLCRGKQTLFHVDAVQAAGHCHIDVEQCNISLMSMAAHKFGGPMGVGVAYIRRDVQSGYAEFLPETHTENLVGIIGAGVAARNAAKEVGYFENHVRDLRMYFLDKLIQCMPCPFSINGGHKLSSIISLTIPGVHGERLAIALDKDGVYVSSGSACNAGLGKTSHVLLAMGLSKEDADCTIRISMGLHTTRADMLNAANIIAKRVKIMKEGENFV